MTPHERLLDPRLAARRADSLQAARGVPSCPAGSMRKHTIDFPECWNGLTLDSADHRSHLAHALRMRGGARVCPPSHAPVPKIIVNARYPTRGRPAVRLASGEAYTAHADFFNAWDDAALAEQVRRCLRADVNRRGG